MGMTASGDGLACQRLVAAAGVESTGTAWRANATAGLRAGTPSGEGCGMDVLFEGSTSNRQIGEADSTW